MAPFLSAEWFAEATASGDAATDGAAEPVVLEQVVRGGPDGTVTYRVRAAGSAARIVWPVPDGADPPDMRITCDWDTAVAVARRELSTHRALMEGRLRVSGSPGRLSEISGTLGGVDAVPEAVRRATTYPEPGGS